MLPNYRKSFYAQLTLIWSKSHCQGFLVDFYPQTPLISGLVGKQTTHGLDSSDAFRLSHREPQQGSEHTAGTATPGENSSPKILLPQFHHQLLSPVTITWPNINAENTNGPRCSCIYPISSPERHISPHQLSHKHSVLPQSHAKGSQKKPHSIRTPHTWCTTRTISAPCSRSQGS